MPNDLPELENTYVVSEKQCEAFQKEGHIRLNHVCSSQEIEAYRSEINEAVNDRKEKIAILPLEERDTYGQAFLQIMNLWPDYPAVAKFVLAKRFADIAAKLMSVERVRIYHDQALYKEAGGGFTPLHQDQHYWPLETNNTITMWMPLMNVTTDMATLNFASGTGQAGYLGDIPISDDSELRLRSICEERGFPIVNHGAMNIGDATFHSGWCLHGAPPNTSNTLREVMTIIFFEDGTRVIPDPDPKNRWNNSRWDDMARWLPDRKPGELADGRLNPRIDL